MGDLIMTPADIALFLVLGLFALWGLKSGFLKMGFGLVSFVVAILLGRLLYLPIAEFLKKTPIYTGILSAAQKQTVTNVPNGGNGVLADIFQKSGEAVSELLTSYLAELVLYVLAFLLVVVAVKILLVLISRLLKLFASLPVIGLVNRIAGMILGLIEGILIVTVFLAGVYAIAPLRENPTLSQHIEKSIVVRDWYLNNPLVLWLDDAER